MQEIINVGNKGGRNMQSEELTQNGSIPKAQWRRWVERSALDDI